MVEVGYGRVDSKISVRIVPIGLEMVCSRLLLVHGVCLNSPKEETSLSMTYEISK